MLQARGSKKSSLQVCEAYRSYTYKEIKVQLDIKVSMQLLQAGH